MSVVLPLSRRGYGDANDSGVVGRMEAWMCMRDDDSLVWASDMATEHPAAIPAVPSAPAGALVARPGMTAVAA